MVNKIITSFQQQMWLSNLNCKKGQINQSNLDLFEGNDNAIMVTSRDFYKTLELHVNKSTGHQTWIVSKPLIYFRLEN